MYRPMRLWLAIELKSRGLVAELKTPENFAPNLHPTFSGVAINDFNYLGGAGNGI